MPGILLLSAVYAVQVYWVWVCVEGQKVEPFSAPLNTIVPLGGETSSAGGGGGEDSDYDEVEEEDSYSGVQHGESSGDTPHDEEVEDFAPISLNVRSVSVVLGALFKNFQSFVFKPKEESSVTDPDMLGSE